MDTRSVTACGSEPQTLALVAYGPPGCPELGAEITPVEPDLASTSEGSEHADAAVGNRAGAGAAARPRHARHLSALDEPRDLPARARPARVFRPLSARRARRHSRRRPHRQRDARACGADRR